jgi:nicotinamide-nucleotide amidase
LPENTVINNKVFRLAGISESAARDLVNSLIVEDNITISYLTIPGEIQVSITVRDNSVKNSLEIISDKVKSVLNDYIFSYDGEVIEELVGRLLKLKGLTIALAESLTGGLIAARLTEVPGSSQYLKGGVVSYTNEIKEKFLGVPSQILEMYGAVSKETATAMAEGIRKKASSDIGLAVTGIAGPGGDTPDKPLGLVYIALSAASGVQCERFVFPGDRTGVRQGTVNMALNTIRRFLS